MQANFQSRKNNYNENVHKSIKSKTVMHEKRLQPLSNMHYTPIIRRTPICLCNGGCPVCENEAYIQTKLKISRPEDKYEIEAEQIANRIIGYTYNHSKSYSSINHCLKKPLLFKENNFPLKIIQSGGNPLPSSLRSYAESLFDHDFNQTRIHLEPEARESAQMLNAKAYTIGHHIVFGEGEFDPYSSEGRHLLIHELVHEIQNSIQNPLKFNKLNFPKVEGKNKSNLNAKPNLKSTSNNSLEIYRISPIESVSILRLKKCHPFDGEKIRVLLDENCNGGVLKYLKKKVSVTTVRELGRKKIFKIGLGIKDEVLLERAYNTRRIIITYDQTFASEFKGERHCGVLIIDVGSTNEKDVIPPLKNFFNNRELIRSMEWENKYYRLTKDGIHLI